MTSKSLQFPWPQTTSCIEKMAVVVIKYSLIASGRTTRGATINFLPKVLERSRAWQWIDLCKNII